MTHLRKLRMLQWVSSNFVVSHRIQLWPMVSLFCIAENPRFHGTVVQAENCYKIDEKLRDGRQRTGFISLSARKEAQAALLDYLHCTRNLTYTDAEFMSQNSPFFLKKLLKNVHLGESVVQYLRYFPINEFEPFYESLGLMPHEYEAMLPPHLTFLSQDDLLLENCHVLCNYGVERRKIGKFCKEATQVLRYDHGVLQLKLQAYEESELRLSRSFVAKMVVCSPYLLIGDVNEDFITVIQILRNGGIETSWIEEHLSAQGSYNWSQILSLLNLLNSTGFSEEQLGGLISHCPGILFEDSGNRTLLLVVLLLKFGSKMNQTCSMFKEFPQIDVRKFTSNLRLGYQILTEIDMEAFEIGRIVCAYTLLLGSCTLKKTNTLFTQLKVGKEQLCKFIQENPLVLKNLAVGLKVAPLENSTVKHRSTMQKAKFLMSLGFTDNSIEMEKALRHFQGRGEKMQERFDSIVDAGFDRKDVCEMIRVSPQILNMSKHVIKQKIDFLVNDLGYPISSLITMPSCLTYSTQRIKLRLAMFSWLKDEGAADPMLSLITLIPLTDKLFIQRYVTRHPRGLQVWEDLKERIYSEYNVCSCK